MNLLENDISQLIIDNYEISVGKVDSINEIDLEKLNDGIVETVKINRDHIKHVSELNEWKINTHYVPNTFHVSENNIYVCLYSPSTPSVFAPTGTSPFNIILDDNYVWRFICKIDYKVADNIYVPITNIPEIIRTGCISSVNILNKSLTPITSFSNFYLDETLVSGTDIQFVVENDQNTMIASDVLIQKGGKNYNINDIISISDVKQLPDTRASVDIGVTPEGKISINSFVNGSNYDYLDIIIIGDGNGAKLNFSMVAGTLTRVTVSDPGSNYTWAKAIVVNSENYIIGIPNIEPLNGYNADLSKHIGPNKYYIKAEITEKKEINYYGIHRKKTNKDKNIYFESLYFVDMFLPLENESVLLNLILGK